MYPKKSDIPIWVAMTGSITVPYELLLTIEWLSEKITSGTIDGIILSTWKGQFDDFYELKKILEDVGVTIIELNYPKYSNEYVGFGSREIQDYQLQACLDHIPNESLVLKCRTDFSLKWLINNEKIIFSDDYINSSIDDLDIRHKILCDSQQPTFPPFRLFDKTFMGHKNDIQKIIQLTNTELMHFNYSSDERLYAIHSNYPIIRDFMMRVKRDKLFRLNDYKLDKPLPGVLRKAYALYFVILYKYYYPRKDEPTSDNIEEIIFDDLKDNFIQKNISWSDIHNIVEGKLRQTPAYQSLLSEITYFFNPKNAKNSCYSKEDWRETKEWGLRYLHMDPDEWLIVPTFAKKTDCNDYKRLFDYYPDLNLKCELDNYRNSKRNLSIKSTADADRIQMMVRYNDREALYILSNYIMHNPSNYNRYISSIIRSFIFIPEKSTLIHLNISIDNPQFDIICHLYAIPTVTSIEMLFKEIIFKIKSDSITDRESKKLFIQRYTLLLLSSLFDLSENMNKLINCTIAEVSSQNNNISIPEIVLDAANSLSLQMKYGIVQTNPESDSLLNSLLCSTIEYDLSYALKIQNRITTTGHDLFFSAINNKMPTDCCEILICYARCYRDGRGVEKDLDKAAEWMRKAADQGLGWAKSELSGLDNTQS